MPRGMIVTDYDGTLRPSDGHLHPDDVAALRAAGEAGYVTVVATGRSMLSYRRAKAPPPVMYVVFSMGAGVVREPEGTILRSSGLTAGQTAEVVEALHALDLSFMVHDPIPENHRFGWWEGSRPLADFRRRLALYEGYTRPLPREPVPSTQIVAIVDPEDGERVWERVRAALPRLSLIRTTSPLDGRTLWLEVFPPGVSKSATTAWLAAELGIDPDDVLAVGNDYNDHDLLAWAGKGCVTANAPEDLKAEFEVVAANDDAGVAEAIRRWREERENASD